MNTNSFKPIDEVRTIISDLHYQSSKGIHTNGPCHNGCGKGARGSGVCPECLEKRLGEIVGKTSAAEYFVAAHKYESIKEKILTKARSL